MADVTINGRGIIIGQFDHTEPDGTVTTFYGWQFSVTVDGQNGSYTVWIDSDTDAAAAASDAAQDLEQDPGLLQDPSGMGPGDFGDPAEGDPGENDQGDFSDDDGDTQVADGAGGGDVGESV